MERCATSPRFRRPCFLGRLGMKLFAAGESGEKTADSFETIRQLDL